jgi:hypothetical protein
VSDLKDLNMLPSSSRLSVYRMEWTTSNVSEALQSLKELQLQAEALARGDDAPTPPPLALTETATASPSATRALPPRLTASAAPMRSVKVQAGAGSVPSAGTDVEVERRMSMLEELRALQREAVALL